MFVIVIPVVLVAPVIKASDIHKSPTIFLYAFVEFFSSMHDRKLLLLFYFAKLVICYEKIPSSV